MYHNHNNWFIVFGTKIQFHNEIFWFFSKNFIFEHNSSFSNSVEMLKMCFLWLIYFCAFCARIFSWMTDFLLKVMVCDAHYQHHKIHLMLSFLPNNNAAKKKKKLTAVFVFFFADIAKLMLKLQIGIGLNCL